MSDDGDSEASPRIIRLNVSDPTMLLIPPFAAAFGFVSGLLTASQKASMQFLAENAHRQPTTLQGWYFYNKTKNYRVAFAALKGGFKTGGRLGLWTGAFVAVKEGFHRTGLGNISAGLTGGVVLTLAAQAMCKPPRPARQ